MNKKLKKRKIKLISFVMAAISPLAFLSSCSLFSHDNGIRSSLEFNNYEMYINDKNKSIVNKYYNYTEFGDLPDFERDIDNGVSVGGVSSDYFSAKLADEGKIRKLNFSKIFGITADRTKWSEELQKYYSSTTWKILNSFPLIKMNNNGEILYRQNANGTKWTPTWDSSKTYYDKKGLITTNKVDAESHDISGDGQDDKLWEFTVPYFLQSKVIAFNPYSFKGNDPTIKLLQEAKDQNTVNAIFENSNIYKNDNIYSYSNILSWLKKIGANTLTVNDYMRDNVAIGSEGVGGRGRFNPQIKNKQEGEQYLNQFQQIINTSWKSKGGKVRPFDSNGTKVLMNLNQVKSQEKGKTDVAIMYNGDALDAYSAGEWESDYLLPQSKGQIRMLIPQNSSWLLDTVVMAKKTTNDIVEQDRFYSAIRNAFYDFATTDDSLPGYDTNSENMLLKNFEQVQYTPSFNYLYHDIFKKNSNFYKNDQMALNFLSSSSNNILSSQCLLNSVITNDDTIYLTNYDQNIGRTLNE